MNDQARQVLCEVMKKYGPAVSADPKRLRALLTDLCPGLKREIHVLVGAAEQGVPDELAKASNSVPSELLLARLSHRLVENLALADSAACWAVESWGIACGRLPAASAAPNTTIIPVRDVELARPTPDPLPSIPFQQALASGGPTSWSPVDRLTTAISRIFLTLFAAVAIVVGLFCLVSWMTQPELNRSTGANEASRGGLTQNPDHPLSELIEVTNKGIKGTYDQNSVRWIDDQLVIDLVLENPSPHDLENLNVSISIGERREDGYVPGVLKKAVQLANWRRGDKHLVVVPIINNDLNATFHPIKVEPSRDRDIAGTATFRKIGDRGSRDYKVEFWGRIDGLNYSPQSASSGMGADGMPPTTVSIRVGGDSSQMYLAPTIHTTSREDDKTAILELQRFQGGPARLPSLQNVKLLVVGYVGEVERFRVPHMTDSWTIGDKLSIPIDPVQITKLKIRGVGRRHNSKSEDVIQQQQVFYICEDFRFTWTKK